MNMHVATAPSHSGLWGYSRPAAYESYMIFCVGNDKVREAAFRSWATAHGIGFKSLQGSYRGQQEASFIINMRDSARCFAWYQSQESVLIIGPAYRNGRPHGSREAHLYFLETGRKEGLGVFRRVSREEALREASWTYDPLLNEYFVCRSKAEG